MKTRNKRNLIEIKNINFSYGDNQVLTDISFSVKDGDILAIIGPNGSGKTTLLNIIAGILVPDSGEIAIKSKKNKSPTIGYVPQRYTLEPGVPLTVNEFMQLERHNQSPQILEKKILTELSRVGLSDFTHSSLSELSGGQFQRVMIARAFLHKKDILLFDEPVTGIDIVGEKTVYDLIKLINKEQGTTCIIVSHEVSLMAKYAKTIVCLNNELTCFGSPNTVLNENNLNKIYGEKTIHHLH